MSSKTLLPWLKLARLPAVFTALADICAGFLLTHTEWLPLSYFLCLIGASATLYLSGMVFNDVFDLEQDRRERPGRPIPSGAISLRSATIFGSLLMLTGLGFSAFVGTFSLFTAILLALAILGYDGGLKRTWLGPFSMGLCRFLNVILGASAGAESLSQLFGMPHLWVAVSMGIYITGVTLFARSEALTSRRGILMAGLVVLDAGLILLVLWMLDVPRRLGWETGPIGTEDALPMLLFWGIVAVSLNRRALGAVIDPVPTSVQPAVGSMLLSIITLDAMIIYFRLGPAGLHDALITLALIIPAIMLRRWISMT